MFNAPNDAGRNQAASFSRPPAAERAIMAIRDLPTLRNLLLAIRRDPTGYRTRAGLGFLAARADGAVVEVFVGTRGGITRRVVRSAA